jgi:hypothetical protein
MTTRRTRALAAGAAALAALAIAPSAASAKALLVCSGNGQECPAGTQFDTIQKAVDAAEAGDWIQLWPGVYDSPTTIDDPAKKNLVIRGMHRQGVVIDGKPRQAPHGIRISGVDGVTLENMTGQNHLRGSSNSFWWTGVDGYWGRYLTTFNTNNYGIYAYNSTSTKKPAVIEKSYGSWTADSAFYIGECRDCNVILRDNISEFNAVGYSGTNAAGVRIDGNVFRHNATGILPNTLHSEKDYPQEGAIIENNHIHDNNAGDVPRAGASDLAPVGHGVLIAGGWNNIVRNNLVENHLHHGVATVWLVTPPVNNQIRHNRFFENGTKGDPGDADIGIDGTGARNCIEHNIRVDENGEPTGEPATTNPPTMQGWHECRHGNPTHDAVGIGLQGPGSPLVSANIALNAAGVSEPRSVRPEAVREYPGWKGAHETPTMPNACEGAPDSAWCEDGQAKVAIPDAPRAS